MTRTKWRLILGLTTIVALFAFTAACGDDDDGGKKTATTGPASRPEEKLDLAADQTLRVNLSGEPDTLDPSKVSIATELAVVDNLFRGPFRYDSKLQLVADMATEVPSKANKGISEDGLTYTIKLKSGLKWSDGKPITSKDLAFAFRRAADPRSGADYGVFFQEIKGGAALGKMKPDDPGVEAAVKALAVETPDELTVKLTLAEPNAVFLNYLGLWLAYPLREDVITAKGAKWIEPGNLISSGPFLLKEWQHKDHITLVPNPNYHGEKATATIRLAMIEDANQAFNAYKAGELDQVSIPSALVPSTKADPQLNKELITIDRLSTFRVSLVNTKAPLDNKKVRQALAYAIDRKALVDVALKGVGKPATSFIPPGLAGYDEKAEPGFNAQKAKQLLAEAGFPDGKGLPKIVFTYTNAANNPPLATNMKEQWKNNLNVDVELEPVDSKTFSTRFKAGDVQFAFVGWGADYPDAENFLVNNFRTGTGNNKSFYSNKEFDALLAKAQVETDRTKAAEIYKQAQKLMQDDSPDIFLFYSQFNALRKPWVKGILNSSMDFQFLGDRFLELAKIVKH